MHPRNPYNQPPDFAQLAEAYPALKPHLISTSNGVTIDFHNELAQRCLTEALLHRDFGVTISIPNDRLCPPVPNRLNYILWMQDIYWYMLDHELIPDSSKYLGIDIGTGASAIYPILGCSVEPRWHFLATDVDEQSIHYANENVNRNGLQDRITVLHVDTAGNILPLITDGGDSETTSGIDFTMCNPPFYASREEVLQSTEAKEFGPSAICTGADNEMITPGGEVAFVATMVKESVQSKSRCRWFSSMLGKMSSLTEMVRLLREEKIENFAITEFIQGRTRRWAIAWTFSDIRLPDSFARIHNPALQSIRPPRNTLRQTYNRKVTLNVIQRVLHDVLGAMDHVTIQSNTSQRPGRIIQPASIVASAPEDSWSRAARRKKLKSSGLSHASTEVSQLLCAIHLGIDDGSPFLEFQWVKGRDRGLFESFMSHVGRKVGAAVEEP